MLCWRLGGGEAVPVALIGNGRDDPNLDGALGPLAPTLRLNLAPAPDQRFPDFLAETAAARRRALETQHAAPPIPEGRHALFGLRGLAAGRARRRRHGSKAIEARQDCIAATLVACEGPGGALTLALDYDAASVEPSALGHLAEEFETLLNAIAATPQAAVDELRILGPRERDLVLGAFQGRVTPAPDPWLLVHRQVLDQCRAFPDDIAVEGDDEQLTGAEFARRVETLTGRLAAAGVGHGTLVGLHLERSPAQIVAMLAILSCGGAYVPLDPSYPLDRLSYMLDDSGTGHLVTTRALFERLGAETGTYRAILVDEPGDTADEPPAPAETEPDDIAYVLYTSGSTGRPKGVMATQGALANHMAWMLDTLPLGPEDAVLQKTAMSFDASVWEYFAPLMSRARLVWAPIGSERDPEALIAALARHRITVLQVVPTLLRLLVDDPRFAACSGLRRVGCGGEALGRDLVRRFRETTRADLVNLYGPTEATIQCVTDIVGDEDGPVSIGRPIDNARIYVLDAKGEPVPIGVPGEMHIGGAVLARGYLGRPGLTEERFLPDPFAPGARMYRSGDIGAWRPDGRLDFLARADDQVKLRGFRVELGEVEAAACRHPGIAAAAVTVSSEEMGLDQLLCFYETRAGATVEAAELKAHLATELPDYMVPAWCVPLDRLPLTPSGKIDRKALEAWLPAPTGAARAPRDTVEMRLERIWEQVLNVQPVGIDGNFFDLGGHSLLAVRLVSEVQREFGIHLPLASLFSAPTVASQAQLLHAAALPEDPILVPIRPATAGQRPIFLVHPTGGNVLCYREIARRLGGDQPVYALQDPGLTGEATYRSVEELAALYVERILTVEQEGPYYLAGWSSGGVIAYEMACQLTASGKQVGVLAMIDSQVDRRKAAGRSIRRGWRRRSGSSSPIRAGAEPLQLDGLPLSEALDQLLVLAKRAGAVPEDAGLPQIERLFGVFQRNVDVIGRYRPRPYSRRVWMLFKADDPLPESVRNAAMHRRSELPALGWENLCHVTVDNCPADHLSIVTEPHVAYVGAALLRKEIEEVKRSYELGQRVVLFMLGVLTHMTFPGTAFLLPLSPMQQGMLFHAVLYPDSAAFFQQLVARLDGPLDAAAFETAWNQLVARHDALRAGFVWEGREHPAQGFAPELAVPIRHLDWREAAPATQEERLARFLADDRTRPFALDKPPLMRVVLIRTGPAAHILVWSHHHLLVDGWSTALALKEFSALYDAAARGAAATLPPPQSFARFLDWLAHRDPAPAREFWRRELSGFAEPTPLSIDRKAGRAAQSAFVTLHRTLGAETAEGLRALARRLRVGPSVPVLAAWALVLARQTQGDEVVFGVTVSGRPATLDGAEELVGLMINTVPLRLRAAGADSVADWLGGIQQRLVAVREYEDCALASIQEWSEIPRGTPLFETIVVFENYPLGDGGAIRIGDLTVTDTRVEERANYPLALLAEPRADGLDLALIVDTDRVPEASGRAALNAVAHLIGQMATAQPDATLDTLKTLTEAERRVILGDWNATATPTTAWPPCPGSSPAAAQQPDAVAVIDDAGEVSYRELDRLSDRIAARIVVTGLAPERPIGLCMRRDRHLVAAMLGVLKAGRAYVPMEPQFPAARIHHIVDVLNIGAMLHQRALSAEIAALLAGRDVTPLVADGETEIAIPDFPAGDPDDLAYVIFTSGSTGQPKGVMVRHRPVVNLIEWVNRTFEIGPADRLLFVTSPCFDLSVYDVFGILAAGGSVRVVGDATLADPDLLAAMFAREPITFWDSAPAALWQVLALLPQKVPGHPLRLTFSSGDWVPLALPGRLRECFERVQPVSLGGATEATVWSNFHIIHDVDPSWVSIPYGRPIQNARYYVLDEALEPVPVGVPGDLYIGGECLADGYAQQPELSAERFLPDPHSDALGAKMYRTGDRARFDGDGVMEFLGRLDTQVKIRGFRIELGEIESVCWRAGNPQVREAAVIVRDRRLDDGTTERDLVAYAAPRDGETLDAAQIRAYLREHLLAPMVPAHVIPLDQLPLSANGKVDRKALPDPVAETTAPRRIADPVVDLIAQSWVAVLGVDNVPADGNFFDLGGHSLRATSAMARLRGALGADIPLRLLFERLRPRQRPCCRDRAAAPARRRRPADRDAPPQPAAAAVAGTIAPLVPAPVGTRQPLLQHRTRSLGRGPARPRHPRRGVPRRSSRGTKSSAPASRRATERRS